MSILWCKSRNIFVWYLITIDWYTMNTKWNPLLTLEMSFSTRLIGVPVPLYFSAVEAP